ncbi:hypothetical protein TREMEDRAFT_72822 [Tremella mesenterica DSM 1558]|uniref:uncharacterized protein n=1 Tax=Tremella mesenterica (strain ATCC 24925 / CBS 8224 / DSM 1558 / NBRC 9311 / NRRL Y-6157 / RJB 2259-6 / UBC 559-6) TaxID=578456 RepID=UPI0003F4A432|nr:uncharacterized protein TREMEDRAFT_72822 [Tremella mesenterica DSM 1558]EIW72623.1 hypothetical protein TREMEDRAFT_72822 [Tremella mesenterica DSM 1558]
MSHKRIGGRFTAASATEAYTRQLTAPVKKWRKAWVPPTGLGPESSFKIYRWVRVDKLPGADLEAEAEENEDNEEDLEDNVDEAEDAEGDEGEADLPPPPETGLKPPPINDALAETNLTAPSASPAPDNINVAEEITPAQDDVIAATQETMLEEPAVNTALPEDPPLQQETFIPPPSDIGIPPNAIEITNVAPGSAELGNGDLGAGGVEITLPETTTTLIEEAAAEAVHDAPLMSMTGEVYAEAEELDEGRDVKEPEEMEMDQDIPTGKDRGRAGHGRDAPTGGGSGYGG